MNKRAIALLLAGSLMVVSTQAVLAADKPKPVTQVPMSTILQNLQMNGYAIVRDVEMDNGAFIADTITPQGKEVKVTLNSQTGSIENPKENPAAHTNIQEVVKKVEGSGYHDITKVEFEGSKYTVRALDKDGKKVKLKVDASTGAITKPWF